MVELERGMDEKGQRREREMDAGEVVEWIEGRVDVDV